MSKDTITVELPIEAEDDGSVRANGHLLSRETWRKVAEDCPGWTAIPAIRAIAPAVVAWIERDEWKPLGLPDVDRTIKATLRDGRVETFVVESVGVGESWAIVHIAYRERYFIEVRPDETMRNEFDIIAWEYVDEPAISEEQVEAMAQFIEDQCLCESCGSGGEHVRKLLARAGLLTEDEGESGA